MIVKYTQMITKSVEYFHRMKNKPREVSNQAILYLAIYYANGGNKKKSEKSHRQHKLKGRINIMIQLCSHQTIKINR